MKRTWFFIWVAAVLETLLLFGFAWLWRGPSPTPPSHSNKIQILRFHGEKSNQAIPSEPKQVSIPPPHPLAKKSTKSLPTPPAQKSIPLAPDSNLQVEPSKTGLEGQEVVAGNPEDGISKDAMQQYLQRVLALVARKKYYPRRSRASGEEGLVIVQVKIARSGEIVRYALTQSSPFPLLNQATQTTLNGLKLPPLPDAYPGSTLSLEIPFRFKLR